MGQIQCCRTVSDDWQKYEITKPTSKSSQDNTKSQITTSNYIETSGNVHDKPLNTALKNEGIPTPSDIDLRSYSSLKVITCQRFIIGHCFRMKYQRSIKPRLEKEREKRYRSALDALDALDSLKSQTNANNEIPIFAPEIRNVKKEMDLKSSRNSGDLLENQIKYEYNDPDKPTISSIYKGSLNNLGQKHGFGVQRLSKSTLSGRWVNDVFTGWNRETFDSGAIIEGNYENGVWNGKGVYMDKTGEIYEGDFKNGMKHGKGTIKNENFEFDGAFENNQMSGSGAILYKSTGDSYQGEFKENTFNGKGVFKWSNGEVYEGEMLDGKMHGHGRYSYPDGEVYEGGYVNGVKQGIGRWVFPSGKVYEGPFLNGKQHGIGRYIKNGVECEVRFENGVFVKL